MFSETYKRNILKKVDDLRSQGLTAIEACNRVGVSIVSYSGWRRIYKIKKLGKWYTEKVANK
jgi:hypothetical protein